MIVGIDLGTTNSAVAVWRDDAPVLVPNALGDLLTPSAVSVDASGEILVGLPARDRHATHPKRTALAFKRLMGTQQQVDLGTARFSPEELSAIVLRSLKADAETFLGEPVDRGVITVPAYFNEKQRRATRRAGELAGLKVERLLNEPTAAALAYGIQDKEEKDAFLVFDLGGGTFDVSIVEMYDGIVEVRSSAGDNRLGGEDFNECLIAHILPRLDPDRRLEKFDAAERQGLLRAAAERARRTLSTADEAVLAIRVRDRELSATVTASEFEQAAEPLVGRLREPVLRSLRDSAIRAEQLSEIVLVGGATRMPVVRRAITRMFGRFPSTAVHPDHAVALGAAVQGGLVLRDRGLDEIRLTDVCPFTLGVEHIRRDAQGRLYAGQFSPLIERNSVIPCSRMGRYVTVQDNQREVRFNIYQGEALDVASNILLGTVNVPVPARPAGQVAVDCRFSYDSSGLLEVDVTVPLTGTSKSITIVDESEAIDPAEIERRRGALAALKVHPREEAENVAVMARATRCYEMTLGDARNVVAGWINAFESALDVQDPRVIRTARTELNARLDTIEGERFL